MATQKKHPSELKASQNGTDIMDYAKRVMAAQSPDLPKTFILARVEEALMAQEYEFDDVRKVLMDISKEMESNFQK